MATILVTEKVDYNTMFNSQNDHKKVYNAYKFAVRTREFEIELFWKRSALFWTFVAATFTGYIAILSLAKADYRLLLLIAILGWIFSLVWHFVSRGSKFWQENWEMHIDQLEIYFQAPYTRQ